MSGFKEPNYADRQKAAAEARQKILEKFRARPGADDPAVQAREAERVAIAANRVKAKEAREAEKAEKNRREAEAAFPFGDFRDTAHNGEVNLVDLAILEQLGERRHRAGRLDEEKHARSIGIQTMHETDEFQPARFGPEITGVHR